jgi:hypothetical protein
VLPTELPPELFADQQPRDGDTVMHCGHLDGGGHMHWFRYDRPIQFKRPDGTRGEAEWFAACEPCFLRHGKEVARFVRGDGRWIGNEPVIERTES